MYPQWDLQAVGKIPYLTPFASLELCKKHACGWLNSADCLQSKLGTGKASPKKKLCGCGGKSCLWLPIFCRKEQSLENVQMYFNLFCTFAFFYYLCVLLSCAMNKQYTWGGLRTNVDSFPLLSEQILFLCVCLQLFALENCREEKGSWKLLLLHSKMMWSEHTQCYIFILITVGYLDKGKP